MSATDTPTDDSAAAEASPMEELAPEELRPEKLPLDAWHLSQGARMVPFAGYEMPIQYAGIVAEAEWTRSSASLFDVSHMGQLTVSGEGAAEALAALLPADIGAMEAGEARYSLLLNEAGGINDDLIVTAVGGEDALSYALVVNGAVKWDDIAWLREHLPDEITLTHHDEQSLVALQGPEAANVLEAFVPGVAALSFMTGALYDWQGTPLWISRSGYTGEDGFEISIPAAKVEGFADALVGDARVKPAGLGARDILRLEAGLPLYGHDLTEQTDPISAGLIFALAKDRRDTGGWIGHDKVMQVRSDGPAQKRIGLVLEGRRPAREGDRIFVGDEQIGALTSGGFSPTLGQPIAMGYAKADYAAPGNALEIEVRGKRLPAQTTKMPFVPHRYHRKGES